MGDVGHDASEALKGEYEPAWFLLYLTRKVSRLQEKKPRMDSAEHGVKTRIITYH